MLTVNESGLYSLIFTSRKPEAKRFRKWVTNEVLPAIRQTGRYVGYSENDPDPIIVWSKLLGIRSSDVITKGFDIGYL
jgi:prophage antirepressor-like protein